MPAEELASVRAIEEQRAIHNVETGVVKEDGTIIWTSVSAVPVPFPDWKVVIVTANITERKRAEEAAQKKSAELEHFSYAVSHDLKSPLVTLRTFLGHLERDLPGGDAARVDKDLGYIRAAADKMNRLLDEILDLSRVGRRMNPPVEAPLQAIVKEALDLVAGRIAGRGVQVNLTEEPVLLYGDRPRLVDIFQNLVDNAVKFMGDQPAPRVEIGVEQSGAELVLFVRDNGIGIDPRCQPKLFGLFEKLDSGMEGDGIGLALVKRIVEVHGGRIWAESAGPGQGATFRFTLRKTRRPTR
jgi:signal transduction histidine kinase